MAEQITEAPPAPASGPGNQPGADKSQPKPPEPKRARRLGVFGWILIFGLIAAALVGGSILWNYLQSYESTDDAQIDGDIYPITSRIAGAIKGVYVEDNQSVKAGQLLVELDPRDYQVSLEQAKAALNESQAQVEAARPNVPITTVTTETAVTSSGSDIEGARAQVAAAEAQVAAAQRDRDSMLAQIRQSEADQVKTQNDLARYSQLLQKDEISRQQFDQAEAAAKAMNAQTDARRSSAEAAARNVEAAQRQVDAARAKLQQALTRESEARSTRPQQIRLQNALVNSRQAMAERQRTMVDQAALNLSYTKIVAPVDGIVGKKSAQAGQQVSPGQQLMALVPVSNLWVTANFKETQLHRMRPGQKVTIHVDAYDRDYDGVVESIAAASGARFSLLPPENATGNYVKVVQRVPVRIRFKEGQDPDHRLRPGMSAEPKVWLDSK